MKLKVRKNALLFTAGGGGYVGLELLWRQRSHGSMFLAGGLCFLLLGRLGRTRMPAAVKGVVGSGVITGVELLAGLIFNRQYQVWDYRRVPVNYRGQICLPFSLLWIPLSLAGMALYSRLERKIK